MNEKGFSLIEVIAIILLSTLLMCFVSAGIKSWERTCLEWKVSEVVQGIEDIKNRAAQSGMPYYLQCHEDRILICRVTNDVYRMCLYKISLPRSMTLPDHLTGEKIKFTGTIAPARAGTIRIVDKNINLQARITVGVATGKVRVYYERPEV